MSDRALDELKSVMSFCTDFGCRRKRLLRYFQETVEMMISRYPQMKPRDRENCCDYCRVGKGGILDVESRKNAGNERPRASPAQLLLAPDCANGAKIGEGEFRDGT